MRRTSPAAALVNRAAPPALQKLQGIPESGPGTPAPSRNVVGHTASVKCTSAEPDLYRAATGGRVTPITGLRVSQTKKGPAPNYGAGFHGRFQPAQRGARGKVRLCS